jgi:hypothetical protein
MKELWTLVAYSLGLPRVRSVVIAALLRREVVARFSGQDY